MHPGPVDSVLDQPVIGFGEPSCPALVGSWFGDVGGTALAVVALALLGLAGVALWHSDLLTPDAGGEPSTPGTTGDTGPARNVEPSVESTADAEVVTDEGRTRPVEKGKTDTEEVVEILEANDGRMRQAAIVETTDWSKSKVSMVLSEMEEDGEVSKLRVGRENIVSLQGNEPEAAGSPFDDE